jgi:hypothetical protein
MTSVDPEHGPVEPANSLVLPFDTDAIDFARGFEVGALWADLQATEDPVEALVHATNSEMVLRMGEALGRDVVGEQLDTSWTRATFSVPNRPAGPSPWPDGL